MHQYPVASSLDRAASDARPAPIDLTDSTLSVEGLQVALGGQTLVHDVSIALKPSSVHCLVGESGSGKTLTSLAAVGLLPRGASTAGTVHLTGTDQNLLDIDEGSWSSIRGSSIGYVGQNALGCLHPAFRVETQLIEAIRRHQSMSKAEARALALEELAAVDLSDTERVARSHPSQLSGGMCQRVALAIALCNRPAVLIADEPTTAIDDDTQKHILQLLRARVDATDLSVMLITHDQRVVDEMADEVTTIANGASRKVRDAAPSVAQTRTQCRPGSEVGDSGAADDSGNAVLEISGVGKTYGRTRRFRPRGTPVLADVSMTADQGTTIGLLGPSGVGKTTLAQIVAGVLSPSEGSVRIGGRPITGAERVGRVEKAGLVQYVFQNPYGSLNPRRSVLKQVAEPLITAGSASDEAKDHARDLLARVGLTPTQIERLPTTLSGGQCQRVGIARALIRRPLVVVLDEPLSALDWAIRAEILDILDDLQDSTGVLYLLISHDRSLVEQQSDRVFEMAAGTVQQL